MAPLMMSKITVEKSQITGISTSKFLISGQLIFIGLNFKLSSDKIIIHLLQSV